MMQVFLVKRRNAEVYAANSKPPRLVTDQRDKAFRFGTHAEADATRRRMKIPLAWEVIACEWDTLQGRIAPDTTTTESPQPEAQP
jgi:hypothetical protein